MIGPEALAELPRASWIDVARNFVQNALRTDMRSSLERMHRTYGNGVMHRAGPFKMVNLFGPDANRLVLLDRDGLFSARKPWMTIMGRIFPNGLLLRDGAEHKHHRKIMHEAFTRPALRELRRAHEPDDRARACAGLGRPRPDPGLPRPTSSSRSTSRRRSSSAWTSVPRRRA